MAESRREYLTHHRSARAWAALDQATNAQMQVTYDPSVIGRDSLKGKHVVVIGSGVAPAPLNKSMEYELQFTSLFELVTLWFLAVYLHF